MRITDLTQSYPPMIGGLVILVERLAKTWPGADTSAGHCRKR